MRTDDDIKHADDDDGDTRLFHNLKTVSEVRIGQKLYIEKNAWIRIQNSSFLIPESIKRWYYGADRETTIAFIEAFYTGLFERLVGLPCDTVPLQRYILALSDSKRGLRNLAKTYAEDNNVVVQLDFIVDRIDQTLQRLIQGIEIRR